MTVKINKIMVLFRVGTYNIIGIIETDEKTFVLPSKIHKSTYHFIIDECLSPIDK